MLRLDSPISRDAERLLGGLRTRPRPLNCGSNVWSIPLVGGVLGEVLGAGAGRRRWQNPTNQRPRILQHHEARRFVR